MGYNYKKKNPVRIGRVNLSNPAELKRVTKLSVNLQLQTEALIKKRPAYMAKCLAICQERGISQPGTAIRCVR